MDENQLYDEILEAVWTEREEGVSSLEELRKRYPDMFLNGHLQALAGLGLVAREGTDVVLTPRGEATARGVMRRHRLAERLLKDVMNFEESASEDEACSFEHSLTPGIVDSICTLLGHPTQCPHGLPIPPGDCCRQARESVEAIVTTLPMLAVGKSAPVSYIASRNYDRIKKLYSFGIYPGIHLTLLQRSPAVVIKVEETQIALEPSVAEAIYVCRGD